jgi:hypothetical protein
MEKTMEEKLPYNYYIDNEKFLESLIDHKKNVEHAKLNNLPKPKIPNYIGECFIKIATNLAKRPNFYLYCVDDKTEALTKRGWLKYNEITTNDIILSLDPKDLNLKWSKVSDLYINESYSGKCYNIKGEIDALVTPGHKWLTLNRGLVKVEDLEDNDVIVVNTTKSKFSALSCLVSDLNISVVDYSGIIWCPKTEYGTFMARRNGKIYITGNSYKDEMIADAIENLCTYLDNFDPELASKNPFGYFTKISWYAFVRRLAKEKKQQYIKYKATETFGTYNDEELLELEDGSIAQIQIYDNLYEFIEKYEDSLREKKELTSKKKGIENFLLDDSEELI